MNKELKDLAAWCIETTRAAGASASRVKIDQMRVVEISYRDHKPENIKEASQKGISIDFFVDGRYSNQSTSDLRRASLQKFISDAVKTTRLLAEDPFRSLPDPEYYQDQSGRDLKIYDPAYDKLSPEDRHQMVKTIEEASLRYGGDKVVSVTASLEDGREETVLMSSNGCNAYTADTYYVAGGSMTLQDEGDRRPNNYYFVVTLNRQDIPSADLIGKELAVRSQDLLGSKKIKTETIPVILENQVVSRLLGGLVTAMSGRNIQQKQSFLSEKKGERVASPVLTLIDDPLLVGGLGSQRFDGDGMSTRRRVMMEEGVLREFYVDWYYSRKLGWKPTTGRPSNLIIPPGKRGITEIMKDLGRGILITGFIGGNSNSTTGDMSVGIIGKLFDKGEFVHGVAEMNIADNHLELWKKLVEVGNDPWPYSSYRTPSLVFRDVVVSGI